MASATKRVEHREWGFEVWTTTFDDKGKKTGEYQSGAAVFADAQSPLEIGRALALLRYGEWVI